MTRSAAPCLGETHRSARRQSEALGCETPTMAMYHVGDSALHELARTTFTAQGLLERDDLQRLLRAQIDIVAPDVLVIAEGFGDFDGANRRIDLLGIDHDGHVVVIELKRTDDGGHMELQALRYAAMVSAMTFDQVVEQRARFAAATGLDEDDSLGAVTDCLDGEPALADDVRIVLVASDFKRRDHHHRAVAHRTS